MTLFLDNGHLTDEGLRALVEGSLDEMERLESAEHLSFCDECLVRYTELLTEPVCQDPPQDLTLPVMRSLRQRTFRTAAGRYATAAAAVLLSLCLWGSGVFSLSAWQSHREEHIAQQLTQQTSDILSDTESEASGTPDQNQKNNRSAFRMNDALFDLSGAFSNTMSNLANGISGTLHTGSQTLQGGFYGEPSAPHTTQKGE